MCFDYCLRKIMYLNTKPQEGEASLLNIRKSTTPTGSAKQRKTSNATYESQSLRAKNIADLKAKSAGKQASHWGITTLARS